MAVCDDSILFMKSAIKDWKALQGMSDEALFAVEIFGFHAQHAIEKALKAWISCYDIDVPRTHDISYLLAILANCGIETKKFENLIEYNPYAVHYRYAAFDDPPIHINRKTVCDLVKNLIETVRCYIEKE